MFPDSSDSRASAQAADSTINDKRYLPGTKTKRQKRRPILSAPSSNRCNMEAKRQKHDDLIRRWNSVPCVLMGRVENNDGSVRLINGYSKTNLSSVVERIMKTDPDFYLTEIIPVADPGAALRGTHGASPAAPQLLVASCPLRSAQLHG